MRYTIEEINKMNAKDLRKALKKAKGADRDELISNFTNLSDNKIYELYQNSKNSERTSILSGLGNSYHLSNLMQRMHSFDVGQMLKIHPDKATMLNQLIMDFQRGEATRSNLRFDAFKYAFTGLSKREIKKYEKGKKSKDWTQGRYESKTLTNEQLVKELTKKSLFGRIRERFSKKEDNESKQVREDLLNRLNKVEELHARYNGGLSRGKGKALENQEMQINVPIEKESQIDFNNSMMSRVMDKCINATAVLEAYHNMKRENYYGSSRYAESKKRYIQGEEKFAKAITREYCESFSDKDRDIAEFIASREMSKFCGENCWGNYKHNHIFNPYATYIGFEAGVETVGQGYGAEKRLGWRKSLLEVEKVDHFTVAGKTIGQVFIYRSEMHTGGYGSGSIRGKADPVEEYFVKDESGNFVRIGCGKYNAKSDKMESFINLDGSEMTSWDKCTKFDSKTYGGVAESFTRKDIEQRVTMHKIQKALGPNARVAEVTQIMQFHKNINPAIGPDENYREHFVVSFVEDGREQYKLVQINRDGEFSISPVASDNKSTKLTFLPNKAKSEAMAVAASKNATVFFDQASSLQNFSYTVNGKNYELSAYRDKDGKLRIAEAQSYVFNPNAKFFEELDTYSFISQDLEEVKRQYINQMTDQGRKTQEENSKTVGQNNLDEKSEAEWRVHPDWKGVKFSPDMNLLNKEQDKGDNLSKSETAQVGDILKENDLSVGKDDLSNESEAEWRIHPDWKNVKFSPEMNLLNQDQDDGRSM